VGFDFARTYAYVNPVVAVLVGYFLGGEALSLRTILGTTLVSVSVVVITMTRAKKPMAALAVKARTKGVGS
jgi:drug/metabolite transporter (DMT)-like permease